MNIENIKGIMESNLWKKILANPGYRGYYIIDEHRKPNNMRTRGQFFVLLVFFYKSVKEETLKRYLIEGSRVPKREGHEMLDNPKPLSFYGTLRMIQFS